MVPAHTPHTPLVSDGRGRYTMLKEDSIVSNPEPPAIIIGAAQRGWCCSVCGGFVRKDAQICKHCQRPFANAGLIADSPSRNRVFFILMGATGSFFLTVAIGGFIGSQLSWQGYTYMVEGASFGSLVGFVLAPIILFIGLRKT